jgi:DHA2 family multidrug resistance protein
LLIWVSALQIMFDRGQDADWFNSSTIVILAVTAAVAFVSWLVWELTALNPIVDLSLFKSRNFALGTLVFCLAYAVFFSGNVLQPLWLQTRLGYIATWAGLVAAPSGAVAVLLTPAVARYGANIDARMTGSVAMLAFAASFFMRSLFPPDASVMVLILPSLVQGVAMSTFFVSMITIQLKDIQPQQTPSASGLSNFARITAGGFSASLVTAFWSRRATLHQSQIANAQPAHQAAWTHALGRAQGAGLSLPQAIGAQMQQVINQAYDIAAVDLFWLFGWLSLLMIPLIWLTGRSMSQGHAVAAD